MGVRRYDFGNGMTAIGDDHRLARRCQPNIFAEFIFEDF
jgi:hypothetical protein